MASKKHLLLLVDFTPTMKTWFILVFAFLFLTGSVYTQDNKAALLLSSAIYEEEVSGNLDKAIDLYLTVLRQYPNDRPEAAKSLYHIGLIKEKMGKLEADQYFSQLINNYPDQKELVALAKERLAKQDNRTSSSVLKAELSFKQAANYYKDLNFNAAAAEYEKVIQLAPKSSYAPEARLWIGQCYFKQGKYDLALKSFNTIITDYPQSTVVPITELMISQAGLAMAKNPKKKPIIT